MNVEQRGNDLEVVLDPMMHFADQPLLAFERRTCLDFGLLYPLDRATEGVAQIVNLGRRPGTCDSPRRRSGPARRSVASGMPWLPTGRR